MKKLTVVLGYLNEGREPINTIESILDTHREDDIEIIAVDDCSDNPIEINYKNVKNIRNTTRVGCGGWGQIGVENASSDKILLIDAHMRFKNDNWVEKIVDSIERDPKSVNCCTCVGLGYGVTDVYNNHSKYYGATMLLCDPEATLNRPAREVLEPKWKPKEEGTEYELPCILGANYFFSKEWFNYIGGLKGLIMWGTLEPFLSLKSFLAGGKAKIRTDIEIGHIFRDNAPYVTRIDALIYNKLLFCKLLLPNELSEKLIGMMHKDINLNSAMQMIKANEEFILSQKKYYESIFTRTVYDYLSKFDIKMP